MAIDAVDTGFDLAQTAASAIPGAGTLVASGLGAAKGIFDIIKSNREQKKAQGVRPPGEDPEIRNYLNYLDRKKRAIETGAAYGRQAAEIGSELANTDAGIVQASGGNPGAAILGMTRAQRGAGDAYANVVATGDAKATAIEGMEGKLLDQISSRKYELQLHDYETLLAESARHRNSGEEAIMAGVARSIPLAFPARKRNPIPPRTLPVPGIASDTIPPIPPDYA